MAHLERLALVTACLALLSLTACEAKPVCGNGIVEHREACDGENPWWQTCADVIAGSRGILACSSTCSFDTSLCVYCGNGRRDPGEGCDCGTDPNNLPAGCTDVNGGQNANCPLSCQRGGGCGDGVKDPGEDCDCGTTTPLPSGCTDVNGGSDGNCDDTCALIAECTVTGYGETCDPLVLNDCCKDEWGIRPVCAIVPPETNATCERECTDSLDCFWGDFCDAAIDNLCQPEPCGPTASAPNTETNAFCTVSNGGGQGWCAPLSSRDDPTDPSYGICVQGNLGQGATCSTLYSGFSLIAGADRSEEVCDMGYCVAATMDATTGNCRQFCDWEAAYAVAFYDADPDSESLPCPAGANCFALATIDEYTGVRSGDLSLCYGTEATDPANGLTSCSLVSGHLLANPAQTCADAGYTNSRCVLVSFTGDETTYGSLVGACMDGLAAPNKAVWDPCDPTSVSDVCPVGCVCEKPDRFGANILTERCVPLCDTAHPAGTEAHCADLGAVPTTDGTPFCRSMSLLFPPGGPLDVMPTRLGLCGL